MKAVKVDGSKWTYLMALSPSWQHQLGHAEGHLHQCAQEDAPPLSTRLGSAHLPSRKRCLPLQLQHFQHVSSAAAGSGGLALV